jgi:hypothetical protein
MGQVQRWSGLSGILAVALLITAVSLSFPVGGVGTSVGDPSADIAAALADNQDNAQVGARLMLAAGFFWILFSAALYGRLRRSDTGWLPAIVGISGAVAASLMLVEASFTLAMTEVTGYEEDTQVAQMLMAWHWNSAAIYAPPLIATMVGTLGVDLARHAFPGWFRWLTSGLLALCLMLSVIGLPGLASGPAMLWVLVASVLLVTRRQGAELSASS